MLNGECPAYGEQCVVGEDSKDVGCDSWRSPAERLFCRDKSAKQACDKSVQVAEDVGVFAETEEYGERGGAAERRKAAEQAVRFARHETEFDDGEATDGCKNEAGKAERTEACLHCECNDEVGNGACDCQKRHELSKWNSVVQKA